MLRNGPVPTITLLTDYGPGTEHVGALHAVLAAGCPGADRIDLTHDVPPGDVAFGALVLARLVPLAPAGVHLAVVDPGVGTSRRALAVRCADGRFIVGPDNGLLAPLCDALNAREAVALTNPEYHRPRVAATFHGRDVFAPVAAHLASGVPLGALGDAVDPAGLTRRRLPAAASDPGRLAASVAGIDRFGNVQLFATPSELNRAFPEGAAVTIASESARLAATVARTFGDVASAQGLVHLDADGHVAVAIRDGNAARILGIVGGDSLVIHASARIG